MDVMLADGAEYTARMHTAFTPPDIDLLVLRRAIPNEAFRRSTSRALVGIAPVFLASGLFILLGWNIDTQVSRLALPGIWRDLLKWLLWLVYWNGQGIAWAGLWSVGHEADHDNISPLKWVNHGIGLVCHSLIFTPYFSWRLTHIRHHKTSGNIDTEEVYVPHLRSAYRLPPPGKATKRDYQEAFEESPIFQLCRLCGMQLLGLHTYLTWNTMGSKRYPKGANHWNPYSGLFTQDEYAAVHVSNVAIAAMFTSLYVLARCTSWTFIVKIYLIPFLLTNHWVMAMTFLQHSCPTVPFYRSRAWSRTRGALSTIDRPFLGWVGKYIFLGVNHHHTTHHLFAMIPFYNLPMAHNAIRPLLGDAYNYDSTPVLRALWRSFVHCLFVEDEGDVVFYKDATGSARRAVMAVTPPSGKEHDELVDEVQIEADAVSLG
ncbi:fatty acid conjugase [Trametes versicolor FP-101664 SS1]|uniref:fatty acid conjugase n=1 Tax=Trametes versicolor (strain FP-101664) TaxID=717944 RepID=UPI0004622AF4|nr:fatty acid conjugase [Trametes versicolor FP-101664 SS1]EIW53388.1 fatty acid conjugase [Trametes versicolor FP-101664 SS1]